MTRIEKGKTVSASDTQAPEKKEKKVVKLTVVKSKKGLKVKDIEPPEPSASDIAVTVPSVPIAAIAPVPVSSKPAASASTDDRDARNVDILVNLDLLQTPPKVTTDKQPEAVQPPPKIRQLSIPMITPNEFKAKLNEAKKKAETEQRAPSPLEILSLQGKLAYFVNYTL